MRLKTFAACCLLVGAGPLVYQFFLSPDQKDEGWVYFSSTMFLMAVGFGLVWRELEHLRSKEKE